LAAQLGTALSRAGPGLMLAPFLIGTAILVGLPVVFTVALAFTDYDALAAPVWQGIQNFHADFSGVEQPLALVPGHVVDPANGNGELSLEQTGHRPAHAVSIRRHAAGDA
jgi:multiple sugar transport system permease protein